MGGNRVPGEYDILMKVSFDFNRCRDVTSGSAPPSPSTC